MDLNALNAALAGLGPWGVLIGIGLTFGAQWLRARMQQQAAPSAPANPVAPAVPTPDAPALPVAPSSPLAPVAPQPNRPLLDALNALLTNGGGVDPEHRGPLLELLVKVLLPKAVASAPAQSAK